MIVGLVAITPAAGYVNGVGAILIGAIATTFVWLSWNKLGRLALFRRVDDSLGVFHTHGVAGLVGGLSVGLFADPHMIVYLGLGRTPDITTAGAFYGHPVQLLWQAGAAATIIAWDALVTFGLLKVIGRFIRLRMPDEMLQTGDVAVHDEELYPREVGTTRGDLLGAAAPAVAPTSIEQPLVQTFEVQP
jgi:Amt family ammonium transporter